MENPNSANYLQTEFEKSVNILLDTAILAQSRGVLTLKQAAQVNGAVEFLTTQQPNQPQQYQQAQEQFQQKFQEPQEPQEPNLIETHNGKKINDYNPDIEK